jgi:hypothetical protein
MTEQVNQPITEATLADAYNEMLGLSKSQEQPIETPTPAAESQVQGTPTNEPTPSPAIESPGPAADDWFKIEKINERFGTNFQSEDEIKQKISSLIENEEYLSKRDYYSELDKFVEEMQKEVSDESLVKRFGSKENYDRAVMHSILSQNIPEAISATILTTDIDKMDDLSALYHEAIAKNPNLLTIADEATIKKGLLKRAGVDISDPDFDLSKYQESAKLNPEGIVNLTMSATAAKNYFKGLVDEAKKGIPIQRDFKAEFETRVKERNELIQKRTNDWTTKAKDIAGQFTEFKIMEKDAQGKDVVDFTFKVPKEFQDRAANYLRDFAVQSGLDVTPETVVKLQAELQDAFEDEYKSQIRKAYAEEKIAKLKEEFDNKVHNNKPISSQEAPPEHGQSPDEELQKQRKEFGLI